jgi:hypothetical protein
MKFSEFKPLALTTEAPSTDVKVNVPMLEGVINLAFLVTEIADVIKKNTYYGKPIDATKLDSVLDAVIMTAAAARLMFKQSQNLTEEALDQVVRPVSEIMDPRYLHGVIGVLTEAGELLKTLGKQKDQLDIVNIQEEMGDILWYFALIEDATGANSEVAMERVIEKLKARFPDKFDADKAQNRDLDVERKILEGN